ncbi:SLAM family member 5-like isoform X2 [Anarhichas minor]
MRPLVALLFAVSLLNSCEAQGSSAVTTVFVQKGHDLILNVDADVPEKFSFVEWTFNEIVSVAVFLPHGNTLHPDFTGRIEFPGKNFSVILKNLQEADSGVYTARVSSFVGGNQQLAEYKVTVQGPVSPVELTVDSVDSVVSRSSDSCNLTVTCSTQHSHINSTFRCVSGTCSQEGGERSELTTSGASLRVYLVYGAIICNHSNQVNWTKDFNMTKHFCPHDDRDHVPVPVIAIWLPILILVIIAGVLVFVLFLYRRKRGNYNREGIENTVYDVPQAKPLEQSPTDDASVLSPTSTYSLVGPHAGSLITTQTGGTTLPESVYAQVEKPARS